MKPIFHQLSKIRSSYQQIIESASRLANKKNVIGYITIFTLKLSFDYLFWNAIIKLSQRLKKLINLRAIGMVHHTQYTTHFPIIENGIFVTNL